jgi:hypothetical protein
LPSPTRKAWDAYADATKRNLQYARHGQTMKTVFDGKSLIERLDAHLAPWRANALKDVKPTLQSSTRRCAEQKKKADEILTGMGCMMSVFAGQKAVGTTGRHGQAQPYIGVSAGITAADPQRTVQRRSYWPDATIEFFNSWMHGLDLNKRDRCALTVGRVLYGVIGVAIIGFVSGVLFASVHNLLNRREGS